MEFLTDAAELLHIDQLDDAVQQLITAQERLTAALEVEATPATARSDNAPVEQVQSPPADRVEEDPDDTPT